MTDVARRWPEAYWSAKQHLLVKISARVSLDALSPRSFSMDDYGRRFAPVIDLAVEWSASYGWVPAGMANAAVDPPATLVRGTPVVFTHGEQEQCPGGPGENILWFRIDSARADDPSGNLAIPYDLRWDFQANLGDSVLVAIDEPVLSDEARLNTIERDIERMIADAPPLIWRR